MIVVVIITVAAAYNVIGVYLFSFVYLSRSCHLSYFFFLDYPALRPYLLRDKKK